MGIESITGADNIPGRQARFRYSPETLKAYEDDLRKLLALEAEGKIIPSAVRIAQYMDDEHGVDFNCESIRHHLNKLRKDKPLWPSLGETNGD